jgi:hypothetical protein
VVAQSLYAEALTLFCELGEAKLCARVLESIACAVAGQGHWDRALRVAGRLGVLLIFSTPIVPTRGGLRNVYGGQGFHLNR